MTIVHSQYDRESRRVLDPEAFDYSNLSRFYCLGRGMLPVLVPSSGTMGNNGAISGLTAFPNTYNFGCYLYLPANAIFTGSAAGLYFTVMSSTTAGTVYQEQYISGEPAYIANPTPFVSTGPGAFTQTTGVDIDICNLTIPGGVLGPNGLFEYNFIALAQNNPNTKTFKLGIGSPGTVYSSASYLTSQTAAIGRFRFATRYREDRIVYCGPTFGSGASQGATNFDMSKDSVWRVSIQMSVATDYMGLTEWDALILPGYAR